jgi:hypothetical protein
LFVAFSLLTTFSHSETLAREKPVDVLNGMAIAYTPVAPVEGYTLSATIGLPKERRNHGWYTAWIMLVAGRHHQLAQPFVQVGLMRWAGNSFKPSFFVAYGSGTKPLIYKDIRVVPDRHYTFSIHVRNRRIAAFADRKEVFSIAVRDIFLSDKQIYGQVAGELFTPGDQLIADIGSIELGTKGRDPQPYTSACFRYDRGLHLIAKDGKFRGTGIFDLHAPSGFTGCQRW